MEGPHIISIGIIYSFLDIVLYTHTHAGVGLAYSLALSEGSWHYII